MGCNFYISQTRTISLNNRTEYKSLLNGFKDDVKYYPLLIEVISSTSKFKRKKAKEILESLFDSYLAEVPTMKNSKEKQMKENLLLFIGKIRASNLYKTNLSYFLPKGYMDLTYAKFLKLLNQCKEDTETAVIFLEKQDWVFPSVGKKALDVTDDVLTGVGKLTSKVVIGVANFTAEQINIGLAKAANSDNPRMRESAYKVYDGIDKLYANMENSDYEE